MAADLDFSGLLPASTNLNFGLEEPVEPPPVVRRALHPVWSAPWAGLRSLAQDSMMAYCDKLPVNSGLSAIWAEPDRKFHQADHLWHDKNALPASVLSEWDAPRPARASTGSGWNIVPARHRRQTLPWGESLFAGAAIGANYRYPAKKHLAGSVPWGPARGCNPERISMPWGRLTCRLKQWLIASNRGAVPRMIWPVPEEKPVDPPPPPPVTLCEYQPVPGRADFNFDTDEAEDSLPADTRFFFWCKKPQPVVNRTLVMLPTATIVKLPSREPISAGNIGLDIDIDSWAWDLSATVSSASLALIQPDSNGPAEIEINLSGHVWNILVESFAEDRQFGSAAYSIQGRSPAAYLAAPYAPARTWTQNNIRTSRQLAEEELANTGWALDWQTEDWLVPGGVFSYDNLTPLDAIGKIAASAGGVILPHPSEKSLTIQPRYRFNVWSLSSAANNAVLDGSILTGQSLQWQPKPKYNGVYAAGQNQGVVVFTKRTGTSGNLLAPQAVDALITTPAAGLERGRQSLNASGNKARVSVSLPLTSTTVLPGLMQPGYVVEITDTIPWKGIVTAVSISAEMSENGPSFQQRLEIERHYE